MRVSYARDAGNACLVHTPVHTRNLAQRDNMAPAVRVCLILDERSSRDHPLGEAVRDAARPLVQR
jgi:hypothetical protein